MRPGRLIIGGEQEDILNCQDWLLDLTTYLHQRRVIDQSVLEAVRAELEPKVPIMAAPGGRVPVTASLGPFAGQAKEEDGNGDGSEGKE